MSRNQPEGIGVIINYLEYHVKSYDELVAISEEFFSGCESLVTRKPWLVCIAMHEYFRNLYPSDPYIPFDESVEASERVHAVTEGLIGLLRASAVIKEYNLNFDFGAGFDEVKEATGNVYGQLWEKFSMSQLTEKSYRLIKDRLDANGVSICAKGKSAIDVGCGSGRFTAALTRFGFKEVLGVDAGARGLNVARSIKEELDLDSLDFKHVNVLEMPFEDNSYDFTFCNGVLHHTSDLKKGLSEIVRITRPGGKIWLYLYGDGGLFWYARKRMPQIMKQIPQAYSQNILDTIVGPELFSRA